MICGLGSRDLDLSGLGQGSFPAPSSFLLLPWSCESLGLSGRKERRGQRREERTGFDSLFQLALVENLSAFTEAEVRDELEGVGDRI